MAIRWMPHALKDFEKIADYYRLNAPAAEREIVSAIYNTISSLADFPFKGKATAAKDTRQWLVIDTQYAVTYRLRGNGIEILRIRHGAQATVIRSVPVT